MHFASSSNSAFHISAKKNKQPLEHTQTERKQDIGIKEKEMSAEDAIFKNNLFEDCSRNEGNFLDHHLMIEEIPQTSKELDTFEIQQESTTFKTILEKSQVMNI